MLICLPDRNRQVRQLKHELIWESLDQITVEHHLSPANLVNQWADIYRHNICRCLRTLNLFHVNRIAELLTLEPLANNLSISLQRTHSDVHDVCRRTRLQNRPHDNIDDGRNNHLFVAASIEFTHAHIITRNVQAARFGRTNRSPEPDRRSVLQPRPADAAQRAAEQRLAG